MKKTWILALLKLVSPELPYHSDKSDSCKATPYRRRHWRPSTVLAFQGT